MTEEKRALAKAIENARKQQKAMADVFAKLATSSSPDRRLERALRERQAERDESLRAVGEALLHWIGAGGNPFGGGSSGPPLDDDEDDDEYDDDEELDDDDDDLGDLPEDDDDTGETVFAADQRQTTDSPTITRRRRRVAADETTGLPPDPDSLKTLAESFGTHDYTEHTDAMGAVRAFMDAVGDAEPPSTPLEFLDGIQRLARVSDRTDRWKRLPRRVQQLFLAYCTCKARVWQENLDLGSSRHEVVLEQVFRALTRYSARERPGFVHGLSRSHRPERETWADDAHYWWTELCLAANIDPEPSNTEKQLDELTRTLTGRVSDPVIQAAVMHAIENGVPASDPRLLKLLSSRKDALENEPRLRTVRRALRENESDGEEPDETEEAPIIGPDWPWLHVTKGKFAVVVGGDARSDAADRIQTAFQFQEVEWDSDPTDRKVESLAKRIKNGSVEMVFFLARFSSHSAQSVLRDACKDAGVPFVRIEHGYGVGQLKLAIENWMHGKQ
ncbi:MAG: hypothetical protein R3F61_05200 [Myxococcota bacterium]